MLTVTHLLAESTTGVSVPRPGRCSVAILGSEYDSLYSRIAKWCLIKAVGPKTSAQQPTFTQATSTDPTVSEVRGGVNAVAENAVRTVVTTTAGVDDDPTPELTRQGVTGRDAVASTPFTPSIDILTSDAAKAALDNLLTALDGINMQRASYGAAINRLEHTMDNLMQMSSNAAATRGRIQDADYAKESTELARTQIVQQASTAMLTQANQSAQSVLALLKG